MNSKVDKNMIPPAAGVVPGPGGAAGGPGGGGQGERDPVPRVPAQPAPLPAARVRLSAGTWIAEKIFAAPHKNICHGRCATPCTCG